MALRKDKKKVIALREQGMSYSQIKEKLGISKGTLSNWLKDVPLSEERIRELRGNSTRRVELFRNTMMKKRQARLSSVFDIVSKDIGTLTQRDIFIAGIFLYWAEGGKTTPYSISLSNTDSSMIRFYLVWLNHLQVPKEKIKVKLQLYADMDPDTELRYWMKETKLPKHQFRKSYIKKSNLSEIKFKSFGHGTCNIIVDNRDIAEYVHQGLKWLSASHP